MTENEREEMDMPSLEEVGECLQAMNEFFDARPDMKQSDDDAVGVTYRELWTVYWYATTMYVSHSIGAHDHAGSVSDDPQGSGSKAGKVV